MENRILTALRANMITLSVAAVLVMLSYALYVICNTSPACDLWRVCGYLFFVTFVAASAVSCIALSGLLYDLLKSTGAK